MHLQLCFADGTEQVPVALGRQRLAHRRQVGASRSSSRRRVTVGVDRHQADHVQAPIGSAFQSRRLLSPGRYHQQQQPSVFQPILGDNPLETLPPPRDTR